MDFNAFAQSRDLLCLSGAFTGLAAGCLLSRLSQTMPRRSRSHRTTLALLFFSGMVAAIAGALIISRGGVFTDTAVVVTASICVPVFALAVCFPRVVAYPLILAGGLAVVWLGYSFLRFPLVRMGFDTVSASSIPLAIVSRADENRYEVNLAASTRGGGQEQTVLPLNGSLSAVEFSAGFISVKRYFPLIGGTVRGLVTQISRGTEVIYADTSIQSPLVINVENANAKIMFDSISPGTKLSVLYDGESLAFTLVR